MNLLPYSRIVRDLIWMAAASFTIGGWFVISGVATEFVLGASLVYLALGISMSALWVEYRLWQLGSGK